MPRTILITGANRGFGRELARVFLASGDNVVATARDTTTLSFESTSTTNYLPLKLDVTAPSDIETALKAALVKFGRIDVVINNAAFGLIGPLETLSDNQVRDQFDVNFFPVVTITREAIRMMRTQGPSGGTVIQVSTIGAALAAPSVSIMSASKAAVETFTECVGNELKPEWGIRLVSLVMSAMDTEAHSKSMVFGDVSVEAYDHLNAR
ncbi:NAD(P)-binding protein, partial [Periconia macrospinosa]